VTASLARAAGKEGEMHLTWKDGWATVAVGGAVILYALWLTGVGTSTRVTAGIVFALGFLACLSDTGSMTSVYGADREHRPPLPYVVLTSIAGAAAVVAGLVAIVTGNEAMLAALVVLMVALWLVTTIRHAITPLPKVDVDHGASGPMVLPPRPATPAWRS
jgi:hypothetical protein